MWRTHEGSRAVFDHVVVDLTTHDAGGVSALDFALAAEMEKAS